jgi:hypothetical protein
MMSSNDSALLLRKNAVSWKFIKGTRPFDVTLCKKLVKNLTSVPDFKKKVSLRWSFRKRPYDYAVSLIECNSGITQ